MEPTLIKGLCRVNIGLYRGYARIVEKKMEATGIIGIILGLYKDYRVYLRVMYCCWFDVVLHSKIAPFVSLHNPCLNPVMTFPGVCLLGAHPVGSQHLSMGQEWFMSENT